MIQNTEKKSKKAKGKKEKRRKKVKKKNNFNLCIIKNKCMIVKCMMKMTSLKTKTTKQMEVLLFKQLQPKTSYFK